MKSAEKCCGLDRDMQPLAKAFIKVCAFNLLISLKNPDSLESSEAIETV